MTRKKVCADCGEIIDDWQAPEGGAWKVDGRELCRFCYLDAVQGGEQQDGGGLGPLEYRYNGTVYEAEYNAF